LNRIRGVPGSPLDFEPKTKQCLTVEVARPGRQGSGRVVAASPARCSYPCAGALDAAGLQQNEQPERRRTPAQTIPTPRRVLPMRTRYLWVLAIVGSFGFAPTGAAFGVEEPVVALEVFPAEARLSGPAAAQRLVVVGALADGTRRDRTAEARL